MYIHEHFQSFYLYLLDKRYCHMRSGHVTLSLLAVCLWVKTIHYASYISFWSLNLGFSNKLSQISHGLMHSTENSAKQKRKYVEQSHVCELEHLYMYVYMYRYSIGGGGVTGLNKMVQNRIDNVNIKQSQCEVMYYM